MMEAGLFFSAEAELTGEAGSALTLLVTGWDDDAADDDVADDDAVVVVWGAGKVAALG